jgi:fumarate reductase subunit D
MGDALNKLFRSLIETVLAWLPTALAVYLDANFEILGGDKSWLANPTWQGTANETARSICLVVAFLLSFYFRQQANERLLRIAKNFLGLFALLIILCVGFWFSVNYMDRTWSEWANDVWAIAYVLIFVSFTVSATAFVAKYIG